MMGLVSCVFVCVLNGCVHVCAVGEALPPRVCLLPAGPLTPPTHIHTHRTHKNKQVPSTELQDKPFQGPLPSGAGSRSSSGKKRGRSEEASSSSDGDKKKRKKEEKKRRKEESHRGEKVGYVVVVVVD